MLKTKRIRRCQGLEKVGRRVVGSAQPAIMYFNRLHFKKQLLFRNEIWLCKKLFIAVFPTIHCVKLAWPLNRYC